VLVASKSKRFNMRWDRVIGTVARLGGFESRQGQETSSSPKRPASSSMVLWEVPGEGAKPAGE